MDQNKYIAFKAAEWEAFAQGDPAARQFAVESRLPDAVVLRGQDAFTPGVLFAYANNVTTTLEILGAIMEDSPELKEILGNLQYAADQFHEMAVYASGLPGKLPD